jgi:hypothetical protein
VDQARLEPEDRRRLRERPERVGGQQLNGDVLSQPREPFANPVDEQTAVGEGAVDVEKKVCDLERPVGNRKPQRQGGSSAVSSDSTMLSGCSMTGS